MASLRVEARERVEGEMIRRLCKWATGKPSGPVRMLFNITERCNLKCLFCTGILIHKGLFDSQLVKRENELSTKEWVRIAKEGSELGIVEWEVNGGEPLLRADTFVAMLRVVKSINPNAFVHLTTNGSFLTAEIAEKLVRLECDIVQLSIDGATPENHDFLRGKRGSLGKVTNAGRLLTSMKRELGKEKPAIQVYTVVNSRNYDELPALASLSHSIGAELFLAMPMRVERANVPFIEQAGLKLTDKQISRFPEAWEQVREVGKKLGIDVHSTFKGWKTESPQDSKLKSEKGFSAEDIDRFLDAFCHAPFCSLSVDALGSVGKCPSGNEHACPGFLRTRPLKEIWYGDFFESARRLMLEGKPLGQYCETCGILTQRFIIQSRLSALIGKEKPRLSMDKSGHRLESHVNQTSAK